MGKKHDSSLDEVVGLFFAVTLAFFIWKTWDQINTWLGNGKTVWLITGGVVILGFLLGKLTIKKLTNKF